MGSETASTAARLETRNAKPGTLGGAPRHHLLEPFRAALAAVEGRRCVRDWLECHPAPAGWTLVAAGKAAASMALGAFDAAAARIGPALVVTRHGYGDAELAALPVEVIEAGHPLPDEASLAAGERLAALLAEAPADTPLLLLLSGGASSLLERLPAGVSLDEWQRVNRWLLASALPIAAVNRVRRGLSCLKGGRLLGLLEGRRAVVLAISDVAGDDPAVIGSGPLAPDGGGPLPEGLPDWIAALLHRAPPAPAADDPRWGAVELEIVARLDDALAAAAAAAERLGYPVRRHAGLPHAEAEMAGRELAAFLEDASPGIHLWGGEPVVQLPERPGRGGRCQQLALAFALAIQGRDDLYLLAAGSDGSDGPGEDAGALVDGGTVARGELHCRAAEYHLAAADAGPFLEAAGDLLHTGPTGTNVTDLVIALKRRVPDAGA